MQNNFNIELCGGCSKFDLTSTFKLAATKPNSTVIVYSDDGIKKPFNTLQNINTLDIYDECILSTSIGMKKGNPKMTVFPLFSNSDHLLANIHELILAAKENVDITILNVHDSEEDHFNPLLLALTSGINFVGQEYSDKPSKLSNLLQKAYDFHGFAFINIIRSCNDTDHIKKPNLQINDEVNPKTLNETIFLINDSYKKIDMSGIIYFNEGSSNDKDPGTKVTKLSEILFKLK